MTSSQLPNGNPFTSPLNCPICASQERKLLSDRGRNFQTLETVICTGCGLIHSQPIPSKEELEEFYGKKYRNSYKLTYKPKLKHTLRYAPGALARVERLMQYRKPGQVKLIDIGSGSGEFIYMASKAGFDVEGVEPHAGYSEYTKESLGLNIINAPLEHAGLKQNEYDAINLNHVLEHMRDPLATLRTLHSLLKPDGLLMVDVPDISACSHAPWTQFHYAHIYNFNHLTLKALVEKAGFEILNLEERSTNLVARKKSETLSESAFMMPENFEFLWQLLNSHTGLEHYKTKTPYSRFIGKCFQYPREFIASLFYRSPRQILDRVYETKKLRLPQEEVSSELQRKAA